MRKDHLKHLMDTLQGVKDKIDKALKVSGKRMSLFQ